MEFLSTMEQLAIEKAIKETCRQNILDLLQKWFNSVREIMVETLNKIEDLAWLKQLYLETISVNSVGEFEELIQNNSSWEN